MKRAAVSENVALSALRQASWVTDEAIAVVAEAKSPGPGAAVAQRMPAAEGKPAEQPSSRQCLAKTAPATHTPDAGDGVDEGTATDRADAPPTRPPPGGQPESAARGVGTCTVARGGASDATMVHDRLHCLAPTEVPTATWSCDWCNAAMVQGVAYNLCLDCNYGVCDVCAAVLPSKK
jgi:hypothetical protein